MIRMSQKGAFTAADVQRLVRTRPFVPFRIHMSDGSMFTVPHTEFALVTHRRVVVAVPSEKDGMAQDMHICAILHITRLEELADAG